MCPNLSDWVVILHRLEHEYTIVMKESRPMRMSPHRTMANTLTMFPTPSNPFKLFARLFPKLQFVAYALTFRTILLVFFPLVLVKLLRTVFAHL